MASKRELKKIINSGLITVLSKKIEEPIGLCVKASCIMALGNIARNFDEYREVIIDREP